MSGRNEPNGRRSRDGRGAQAAPPGSARARVRGNKEVSDDPGRGHNGPETRAGQPNPGSVGTAAKTFHPHFVPPEAGRAGSGRARLGVRSVQREFMEAHTCLRSFVVEERLPCPTPPSMTRRVAGRCGHSASAPLRSSPHPRRSGSKRAGRGVAFRAAAWLEWPSWSSSGWTESRGPAAPARPAGPAPGPWPVTIRANETGNTRAAGRRPGLAESQEMATRSCGPERGVHDRLLGPSRPTRLHCLVDRRLRVPPRTQPSGRPAEGCFTRVRHHLFKNGKSAPIVPFACNVAAPVNT